jgi:thiol peroxidase
LNRKIDFLDGYALSVGRLTFPSPIHNFTELDRDFHQRRVIMQKRANAVTFKGTPLALVGPELKAGDKAPDFTCLSGLELVTLAQTPAKARMFSVVPSLDTPVCSIQTKKFDEGIAALKDKATCYIVSLDLPFAQKRFCAAEKIANMHTLSDVHNNSFGTSYGVLIEGLPLKLLARSIFVVDKSGKLTYVEYVPEVANEPNYDKALAALKAASA